MKAIAAISGRDAHYRLDQDLLDHAKPLSCPNLPKTYLKLREIPPQTVCIHSGNNRVSLSINPRGHAA